MQEWYKIEHIDNAIAARLGRHFMLTLSGSWRNFQTYLYQGCYLAKQEIDVFRKPVLTIWAVCTGAPSYRNISHSKLVIIGSKLSLRTSKYTFDITVVFFWHDPKCSSTSSGDATHNTTDGQKYTACVAHLGLYSATPIIRTRRDRAKVFVYPKVWIIGVNLHISYILKLSMIFWWICLFRVDWGTGRSYRLEIWHTCGTYCF